MSELTLLVLRIGFLIALWVFVFFVVYAVRSDLFGQRVRKLPSAAPASAAPPAASSAFLTTAQPTLAPVTEKLDVASATGAPLHLVITSGALAGQELPLGIEDLTIGRSPDSSLVIQDDYTSTHHARLELRHGVWMLHDLDSTNGTTMNGVAVHDAVPISLNTPIAIGGTTFEVRR
jgi:hypothetical protein